MTRKMHRHSEMRLLHCPPAITIQRTDDLPYWLNGLNKRANVTNYREILKWREKDFFVFFSPFLTISFLPFIKIIPAFAIASHRRTPSNLIITCHLVCFFSLRHKRKKFFISFFCKPYSHFLKFTICSKKDIKNAASEPQLPTPTRLICDHS